MTPTHNNLDQITREILHYEDLAIEHAGSAIRFKVEIGKRLNAAKEILPHGEFLPWVEKQFKWSPRHCQKHMHLARNAARLAYLPETASLRMALQAIEEPKTTKPAEVRPIDQNRMDIGDVIQVLETALRMGTTRDTPEGSRYIQISETLVKLMVRGLKREQRLLPKAA